MKSSTPKKELEGLVCAIVTPFDKRSEQIDKYSLRSLCQFLIKKGIEGLYPCGTNGEFLLLTLQERKLVAEIVMDEVEEQLPIVIHCGATTTKQTIELVAHASHIGASGAGIIVPPFYPLDGRAIEEHFKAIAHSVPDFPLYLYNIPSYGQNDLTPEMARRIFNSQHCFVGIKYSGTRLRRLVQYINIIPEAKVFIGCDGLIFSALELGAAGTVSGTCMCFPELFASLFSSFRQGKLEKAKKIQDQVSRISRPFEALPVISSFKEILRMKGIINYATCRAPLRQPTSEEKDTLGKLIEEANKLCTD